MCTEGPKRGNQALTPRNQFCREKPSVKKALAEVEESLLHMPVLCQSFSRRSPRTSAHAFNTCISGALEWKAEGLENLFSKAALQSEREAVVLEKQISQALRGWRCLFCSRTYIMPHL